MTDHNDAQRQAAVVPRQDGHFAGKVAFITAATSGIDRATALAFRREGARARASPPPTSPLMATARRPG
jgi:NADP-dependent 3-hydroxy acid dehydrogenase YdfG